MSAPNTNVEKQEKRHAGPLIGMVAAVLFVGVLLIGYTFFIATPDEGAVDTTPDGEAVQAAPLEPQVNAPPSASIEVGPRSGQTRAPGEAPTLVEPPGTVETPATE